MTLDLSALPTDTRIDDATADLLFRQARTAATFSADEVPDEQLQTAYDLAKWGPTAMNITPLRVLVVRSAQARERLASHMNEGNRDRVLAAPVTLVLAADREFHQHLSTLAPHRVAMIEPLEAAPTQRESMSRQNAWLQAGYFITALRAVGLAVGAMAGMDAAGVDEDLLAGSGWQSFLVLNVGQADGAEYPFPRAARLEWDQATRTL
ncbi:MAG TPA: malonic semialdehyde reductase [Cellulomonas sp.]